MPCKLFLMLEVPLLYSYWLDMALALDMYYIQVWPYEENDEYGFVQELFSMMEYFFQLDFGSNNVMQSSDSVEV